MFSKVSLSYLLLPFVLFIITICFMERYSFVWIIHAFLGRWPAGAEGGRREGVREGGREER